jgi:hypothetical protein
MSILPTTSQLAVPPPRRVHARLLDGTGEVGWIANQRLGFTGFATLNEAMVGAWVAHVALERRAAKSRREPAPYIDSALRLTREAEDEWIEVANKHVARLLRPVQPREARADEEELGPGKWFGFEIPFPAATPALDIDSSAHVVYRGLRRSGVPWAIRDAPLANGATVEAAAAASAIGVPAVPLDVIYGAALEVQHVPVV